MKNQLSYTPFILLPSLKSISFYFSKNFRYTIVIIHFFFYNFKVITYMAVTDSTNLWKELFHAQDSCQNT